MSHLIACRARISERCLHGQPTRLQFGEDLPMDEDGTYDGQRIVCDPCYVPIVAASPSGSGTHAEIAAMLPGLQREGVRFEREMPDPDTADQIIGAPPFVIRLHDTSTEQIVPFHFSDGEMVAHEDEAVPLHDGPGRVIAIFGFHALSRYREDRPDERAAFTRGALAGWWFSPMCPEGEPGTVALAVLRPIHRADFFYAARRRWELPVTVGPTGVTLG